jgi:DNA repair exonuclease SbcCD ATPase subunit
MKKEELKRQIHQIDEEINEYKSLKNTRDELLKKLDKIKNDDGIMDKDESADHLRDLTAELKNLERQVKDKKDEKDVDNKSRHIMTRTERPYFPKR